MNRELLNISGCKRSLAIEVSGEEVESQIQELAAEYVRKAKVPGFRPGKVPLKVIRQRFQADLRQDAVQKLVSRNWKDAIQDLKLNPLNEPSIDIQQNKPDEPLKFSLTFEVLPEIDLQGHKGVAVELPIPETGEAEVEKTLAALQDQQAQFAPVEDQPIQDSHYVSFSLDGTFADGGKPFHEDEVTCIVGDPRTNEVFSENLRGAKAGDVKSFEVSYPEDYHRKQFAGKRVQYRAQVKEVKEKHLPELNDEFAAEVGAANLEALKNQIRDDLVTKAQRNAEKKAKETALEDIVKRHSFEVPDCLVEDELMEQARRIASDLAMQGIDIERASVDWGKIRDERRPFAEQAVRRSLILDAVAKRENIEVEESELEGEIRKHAAAAGKPAAALRAQLEKDHKIDSLREHLRQNKALDFIYRNATISRG